MKSEEVITLAHGEGARATRSFIEQHILRRFGNASLDPLSDAAALVTQSSRLAFTTDSYVVSPLVFPGGDIGSLAVYGTVNDLAVSGALPKWISVALIIEEGFLLSTLEKILDHIASAAERCHVSIVCGDTKVVPRRAADGLFINTAGIGELMEPVIPGPQSLLEGDAIIVSGPIGRHGIAVLSVRENLGLEPPPQSDAAPLFNAVSAVRERVGSSIRCIRDATRGGVSAVLHEWTTACRLTVRLDEQAIPVSGEVRGACELLGLDALHIASEGTMVLAVDPAAEDEALSALREIPETQGAMTIGRVTGRKASPVTIQRLLGGEQPVDEPTGALLPRIC